MTVTNSKRDSLLQSIDQLRRFDSITGIVHVGSGFGTGAMHQWRTWDVPRALLIEADAERSAWIDTALADNPGWRCVSDVISAADGEVEFFVASNPAESGLLEPESLRAVWPNLHTVEKRKVAARRLDSVFGDLPVAWSPDWLLIDCLPALPILRGAEKAIDHVSVVWLRAILGDASEPARGATLAEIESHLAVLAFRLAAVAEGTHPAIGEALFVRDWRLWFAPRMERLHRETVRLDQARNDIQARYMALEVEKVKLIDERKQQAEYIADLSAQAEQLRRECGTHARQERERIADAEVLKEETAALSLAKTVLEDRVAALEAEKAVLLSEKLQQAELAENGQAQIERLIQARDEQARLAADWQTQIEALAQARDEQARLAAERQAKIKRLNRAGDEQVRLAAERQAQTEALAQARDEQARLVAERQTQIEALAQARDEQARLAAERQAEIERLNQVGEEQARLAAERQAQIEALAQAWDEQVRLVAERQTQIEALAQARDEQARLAAECQAEIERLTQARDEQVRLAAEWQTQTEALTQSRDEQAKLAAERQSQIDALILAKDEQTRLVSDLQAQMEQANRARQEKNDRIAQLEAQLAEMDSRQRMFNEEMIKAEAQIDLIKDILLREPGL
jgi:YD repeat-containing protein